MQFEQLELIAGTVLGAALAGAFTLVGVLVQGRNESKRATLTSSANLAAAIQAETHKKVVQAVENLWLSLEISKAAYSNAVFMHSAYSPEEINDLISKQRNNVNWLEVYAGEYKEHSFFNEKKRGIEERLAGTEVLHVSPRLWTLYKAIVTAQEHLGRLMNESMREKEYADWREDTYLLLTLRRVSDKARVEKAAAGGTGELGKLFTSINAQFVLEASSLIRGSRKIAYSMKEISSAISQSEDLERAERKKSI